MILMSGHAAGGAACKDQPAMVTLVDRLRRDGVLLASEGLRPAAEGRRVRRATDGSFAVVDGPFAEAKELVGGFVIVRVADRAAAVDVARQILGLAVDGTTAEVRELTD